MLVKGAPGLYRIMYVVITMTNPVRYSFAKYRQFDYLFKHLFRPTTTKTLKPCITSHFWRESTGRNPAQGTNDVESVPFYYVNMRNVFAIYMC